MQRMENGQTDFIGKVDDAGFIKTTTATGSSRQIDSIIWLDRRQHRPGSCHFPAGAVVQAAGPVARGGWRISAIVRCTSTARSRLRLRQSAQSSSPEIFLQSMIEAHVGSSAGSKLWRRAQSEQIGRPDFIVSPLNSIDCGSALAVLIAKVVLRLLLLVGQLCRPRLHVARQPRCANFSRLNRLSTNHSSRRPRLPSR